MIKNLIVASISVLFLASFSPVLAQKTKSEPTENVRSEPKFLDDIEIKPDAPPQESAVKNNGSKFSIFKNLFSRPNLQVVSTTKVPVEEASNLQLKYSILLDTEVEEVQNIGLFDAIDEWYGTPYHYGGTTKRGIDCSAFVQTLYTAAFGLSLPRTAREQYKFSKQISRIELKQGDLIFFNTTGGVSHVGMYLQNDKFVHAASSGGVMISDLYDAYWVKRFIGAGRIESAQPSITLAVPQP